MEDSREDVIATVVEFFRACDNEPILSTEMYDLLLDVSGPEWPSPFTFKTYLDHMVAEGQLVRLPNFCYALPASGLPAVR